MEEEEMIIIAKTAIDKRMDYETLKYSDDLYGKEEFAQDVWAYVEECEKIGRDAFFKKYR